MNKKKNSGRKLIPLKQAVNAKIEDLKAGISEETTTEKIDLTKNLDFLKS